MTDNYQEWKDRPMVEEPRPRLYCVDIRRVSESRYHVRAVNSATAAEEAQKLFAHEAARWGEEWDTDVNVHEMEDDD